MSGRGTAAPTLVMVTALGLTACSPTATVPPSSTSVADIATEADTVRPSTGAPDGTEDSVPTTQGVAPVADPGQMCEVQLPQTWRDALSAPRLADRDLFATLLTVHDDGSRAEALYLDADDGVILIWTSATGEQVEVMDLSDTPGQQVLGASFDGRYLAFSVYESEELFSSPWTGFVWDSVERGEATQIAASPREDYPDGAPGAMPLMYPLMNDGVAYWVQSDPTEEERDFRALKSYDVGTRQTETLTRGPFDKPKLFGDSLLVGSWPQDGQAHVLQIPIGAAVPEVPGELLAAQGLSEFAAGGDSLAWVTTQSTVHLYDPDRGGVETITGPGTAMAEQVGEVGTLTLNGDVLTLYGKDSESEYHQYVYDTRSESFTSHAPLGSSDFHAYPGHLALHHTDAQDNHLEGRAVVLPMDEVPPLPGCEKSND
jgi:hypothetical protein